MTTKYRSAAAVAEARIIELSSYFQNLTAMPDTKTVHVPHLGGIDASYRATSIDPFKPTLVLVNSFTTSSELYRAQFEDQELTNAVNLISIELLGHGQTRTKAENWTYWDTAFMNLEVLRELGVKKNIFVLGTSQGGWITVRMALLAPDLINGIIPLGTSMDFESERTRSLSCWNAPELLTPFIQQWTSKTETSQFQMPVDFCNALIDIGFGQNCAAETRDFWTKTIQANYQGDSGRRRARMAAINLRDRDSLHGRLFDVRCPVLWMHGTADVVYSVANAKDEIPLFENSPDAQLKIVEDGQHFLSYSHPKEVKDGLLAFISKYGK